MFYLSKRSGSVRGVLLCRGKIQVCNHYTRQDSLMGITEQMLLYYKGSYTSLIFRILHDCVVIQYYLTS